MRSGRIFRALFRQIVNLQTEETNVCLDKFVDKTIAATIRKHRNNLCQPPPSLCPGKEANTSVSHVSEATARCANFCALHPNSPHITSLSVGSDSAHVGLSALSAPESVQGDRGLAKTVGRLARRPPLLFQLRESNRKSLQPCQ